MTQYSLFVLKVPLNTELTNKQSISRFLTIFPPFQMHLSTFVRSVSLYCFVMPSIYIFWCKNAEVSRLECIKVRRL